MAAKPPFEGMVRWGVRPPVGPWFGWGSDMVPPFGPIVVRVIG
jgi:hypothetical protein